MKNFLSKSTTSTLVDRYKLSTMSLSPAERYWGLLFVLTYLCFSLANYWVVSDSAIFGDSWIYAVNHAFHKKWIFGTEFVFTYGPLGWLATALPKFAYVIPIVIFRLTVFFAQAVVYYKVFLALNFLNRICFLVFFAYAGATFNIDISMYLALISLGLFVSSKNLPKTFYYTFSVLCGILFFVKQNIAVVNILLFCIVLAARLHQEKNIRFFAINLLCTIATIVVFALFLPIHLATYILSGFDLAGNYNDAMAFETFDSRSLVAALIIVFLVIGLAIYHFCKKSFSLVRVFLTICILYLFFKQGFTRADAHQLIFFGAVPIFLLLAVVPTKNSSIQFIQQHASLVLMLTGLYAIGIVWKYQPVPFWTKNEEVAMHNKSLLPGRILRRIEKQPIDLIPGDISIAYANRLNYKARPVPQSYSVYSEKLQTINADFMKRVAAPEFVIFRNGSIDDRHPFWDETLTKISLLENYKLVDSFDVNEDIDGSTERHFLLFKKSRSIKSLKKELLLNTQFYTGATIKIPETNKAVLMYGILPYTWLNKCRRFLFHPRFAYLRMYYHDGSESVCRWIPQIMNDGVFINYRVNTSKEAASFFKANFTDLVKVDSIKVISNDKWFAKNLTIRFESTDR